MQTSKAPRKKIGSGNFNPVLAELQIDLCSSTDTSSMGLG